MAEHKLTKPRLCSHCGNTTRMEIRHTYRTRSEEDGIPITYATLVCPTCLDVLLVCVEDVHPDALVLFGEHDVLYPSRNLRVPRGLPQPIAKEYQSALRVRAVDANAFGAMVGRVLELVMEDQQAEGKTLYQNLESLAQKGKIPERVAQIAHRARAFRNVGAHAKEGSLGVDEVPVVDDLCRAVLEYIYSLPHLLAQAERHMENLGRDTEGRSR